MVRESRRAESVRKKETERNEKKKRRLISTGSLTEFPFKQRGEEMHALKLDSGL